MADLSLTIRQVLFSALAPLKREALKARLSFKDTQNTIWWGAFIGSEVIGCAAMIWIDAAHTRIRPKSFFILPEWQQQGYGRTLNTERLRWAREETSAITIEAFPKRRMIPMWTGLGFE